MANNYYPQSDWNSAEPMTVGALVALLLECDQAAPVLFRSPRSGAFGSNQCYTTDGVEKIDLPAFTVEHPEARWIDEDTDEEEVRPAYSEQLPAWAGVVIV